MPTRYVDAQTVSDEHGKGAEILRTHNDRTYQFSSPSSAETIIHGPWKIEVDSQLREAVINVTDQPDADADITLYVYRNQQRVQLTASTPMDNTGADTAALGPTIRVPWDWALTGQLSCGASCAPIPQVLFFLCSGVNTIVHFRASVGLFNANCATGALVAADFDIVDTSCGGISISSVCHTAGNNFGTITLSGAGVSTACGTNYDLVGTDSADTLAPASSAIFGPLAPCGGACSGVAAAQIVQPISGDTPRNVFPLGDATILYNEDMLYAETVRSSGSSEYAAWSVEIGWMPALYGQTDYRSFP